MLFFAADALDDDGGGRFVENRCCSPEQKLWINDDDLGSCVHNLTADAEAQVFGVLFTRQP